MSRFSIRDFRHNVTDGEELPSALRQGPAFGGAPLVMADAREAKFGSGRFAAV
jgi:hypothetical protein